MSSLHKRLRRSEFWDVIKVELPKAGFTKFHPVDGKNNHCKVLIDVLDFSGREAKIEYQFPLGTAKDFRTGLNFNTRFKNWLLEQISVRGYQPPSTPQPPTKPIQVLHGLPKPLETKTPPPVEIEQPIIAPVTEPEVLALAAPKPTQKAPSMSFILVLEVPSLSVADTIVQTCCDDQTRMIKLIPKSDAVSTPPKPTRRVESVRALPPPAHTTPAYDKILDALSSHRRPMSRKDIANRTGLGYSTTYPILRMMVSNNQAQKVGSKYQVA